MSLHRQILVDSPLGYWPLDDGAATTTVKDASGNARDCSWADGTRGAGSFYGSSDGDFDGSDHVRSAAVVAAFNLTASDVTFEFWAKYSPGSATLQTPLVVRDDAGNNAGTLGGILLDNGTAGLVQGYDGANVPVQYAAGINDGVWHHIAYVMPVAASATHILYIDATPHSATYTRQTSSSVSKRMCIGGNWNPPFGGGSLQRVTAQVAHAAFYGAQLSQARVIEHYRAGRRTGVVGP